MIDWPMLALFVLASFGCVLIYVLGYRMGTIHAWREAKNILRDSAKIAGEVFTQGS